MKKKIMASFWVIVFFIMLLFPLVLLMILPRPPGREFLRELSIGLGFLAMSLLGVQTIPTSRLKFVTRYFPMENLYTVHHHLSIFAMFLALVHPILLFINNPNTLRLLNFITAPMRARAAVLAVLMMVVLVITSVWREAMKLKYDVWRWIHDALAFLAIGLALYHMYNVNYYMSLAYQRVLWFVFSGIWVAVILYIRVVRPIIMLKKPYEVVEVKKEYGQSWTLYLKPVGHDGFEIQAGQFAWITTESPFIFRENPFSFSSSADRDDKIIGFTIKELGDFSSTIKDLQPGDTVYVDGPYGTFNLDEHYDSRLVLIAGGIGSAPVLSILRTMRDRGRQESVKFFYGNPTWDMVIFREELEELAQTQDFLQVINVLERPHEGWEGETGYITAEIIAKYMPEDYKQWEYIFFLCGPMPMIEAVEGALRNLDVQSTRIFSEKYEMA